MAERSPKFHLSRTARGWVKSIDGRTRYVCSVTLAPTGADADRIFAARFAELLRPQAIPLVATATIGDIAELFVAQKQRLLASGEIVQGTFDEYCAAAQDFLDSVGDATFAADLAPSHLADFRAAIAARFGPRRLRKWIVIAKSILKTGSQQGLLDRLPDMSAMQPPSRAVMRRATVERLFTPRQIRRLLIRANPTMYAMILLGLHGMGNADVSRMQWGDIRDGVYSARRQKTGIPRRVPLWPEALAAIELLPRQHATLVFATREGAEYQVGRKTPITRAFSRLAQRCRIVDAHNFYTLRRTFRTIADEVGDQRAAALIMGHDLGDMGGVYVQRIGDDRLRKVIHHVRAAFLGELGIVASVRARHAAWVRRSRQSPRKS